MERILEFQGYQPKTFPLEPPTKKNNTRTQSLFTTKFVRRMEKHRIKKTKDWIEKTKVFIKGALKLLAAPLIILRHVSPIGSGDHILAAMELKFCTGTAFMFLDLPSPIGSLYHHQVITLLLLMIIVILMMIE